jgi:hypothetical protein
MKRILKWCVAGAFGLLLAVLLVRAFAGARPDPPDQDDEEQEAVKAPSRVSVVNGETVLKIGPATQVRMGVTAQTLRAASDRREVTAPTVVLSAQELIGLRNAYVAAEAQLEKARLSEIPASAEYQRLKTLYVDHQNASKKALDAAESVFESDQADVRADVQDLTLQAAAVREAWGNRVAEWISDDSPELKQVLDQRELLVQMTVPAEDAAAVPRQITIALPGAELGTRSAGAHLISAFPRVDPRVQGASFLFATPSRPGLAPGTNLVATMALGKPIRGVVIPEAAVTWWHGKAWLYQQTASDEFVRRGVPTEVPTEGGYFTAERYKPGDKVVTGGVQALLSEELRSQIQPED